MSSRDCPICHRPVDPAYAPFCSKRCADVDLQRWFSETYRAQGAELDEPEAGPGGEAGRAEDDPL
jgi:uncharacterized protein